MAQISSNAAIPTSVSSSSSTLNSSLESALLNCLAEASDGRIADSNQWLQQSGLPDAVHEQLSGVLLRLASMQVISFSPIHHSHPQLTAEGQQYREAGSPEAQLFRGLPPQGAAESELLAHIPSPVLAIGVSQAMKNKWIRCEGDKRNLRFMRVVSDIIDDVQQALMAVAKGEETPLLPLLRRRRLVTQHDHTTYSVSTGPKFSRERTAQAAVLTMAMLKNDKWKSLEFKSYNTEVCGPTALHGTLHPLMKVRRDFRQVFHSMGFTEMPTNQYVESSFWNFDTLFQPQQHPARDAHDTFFVYEPQRSRNLPDKFLQRTKTVHEQGGWGSLGYRYPWKREEAEKNILRTHTTSCSSRMLYLLAQGEFSPRRYFSIDRVFRNETLDATHLAEFYQIEGLIADRNLTLGDLIGTISSFFEQIGITGIKFKPAYNPYTEPSMEIFGYSHQLQKEIEIGNSGMFRPEMLLPLGLPPDVRVIAWGMGLERQTMLVYGIRNIRDLFGSRVKLNIIENNPICRFDKHQKYPSPYVDDSAPAVSRTETQS